MVRPSCTSSGLSRRDRLSSATLRFGAFALAPMMSACATAAPPLPQIQSWLTTGAAAPPLQRECPHVADVDLGALARAERTPERIAQREQALSYMRTAIDAITIPASSPFRPGADATVVLRAVSPPGGGHSNTIWSVVWRDSAGDWWFWKQNRTTEAPPPPPPPGTPEHAAYFERFPNGIPSDDIRWPPETGRLNADLAATLEATLNNPCRAWEPDIWPHDTPLTRGRRDPAPPMPQDSSSTYVELREGEHVRFIAGIHHRDSLQDVLVSIAAYPR